jgi:hypothetical protein
MSRVGHRADPNEAGEAGRDFDELPSASSGLEPVESSRVVIRPTFLNTVNVGWALPTAEAGMSYILVANAHPTPKKFCSDSVTQSTNQPIIYPSPNHQIIQSTNHLSLSPIDVSPN